MRGKTDFTDKKEDLQTLATRGCPIGHDFNNSKCPFRNVRKLTAKDLAHYINNLSEEQIDSIFAYHKVCSSFFSFLTIKPSIDTESSHPSRRA